MTNPIVQMIVIMAFGVVTGGTYYITKDSNAATSAAADIASSIEVTHLSIDDAKGNPKTVSSNNRGISQQFWEFLQSVYYSYYPKENEVFQKECHKANIDIKEIVASMPYTPKDPSHLKNILNAMNESYSLSETRGSLQMLWDSVKSFYNYYFDKPSYQKEVDNRIHKATVKGIVASMQYMPKDPSYLKTLLDTMNKGYAFENVLNDLRLTQEKEFCKSFIKELVDLVPIVPNDSYHVKNILSNIDANRCTFESAVQDVRRVERNILLDRRFNFYRGVGVTETKDDYLTDLDTDMAYTQIKNKYGL
jgi:hypothetical protein